MATLDPTMEPWLDSFTGELLFSLNRFPGDGIQTTWEVQFAGGYIRREHIKSYRINQTTLERVDIPLTDANFVTDFQITVTPAVPAGWLVYFYRDTPKDTPIVDFTDGARITEINLDRNAAQAVFVAGEVTDVLSFGIAAANEAAQDAIDAAALAGSYASSASTSASNAAASEAAAAGSAASAAADAADVANAIADHEAEDDPHPQYLKPEELAGTFFPTDASVPMTGDLRIVKGAFPALRTRKSTTSVEADAMASFSVYNSDADETSNSAASATIIARRDGAEVDKKVRWEVTAGAARTLVARFADTLTTFFNAVRFEGALSFPNITASRALVVNASNQLQVSSVTTTELGYLSGASSSIQTQLNSKEDNVTGGATSILTANLTASRALVSDASGKVAVSAVTASNLGALSGITSNVQDQLDAISQWPGQYTGSSVNNTSFPVGSSLCAVATTGVARNSSTGCFLYSARDYDYATSFGGTTSTAVPGTWRMRGTSADNRALIQRTA